ncbi:MAG: DUF3871 family protein [Paludibacter sp.]|nr:DUF3871 family protein [Paludibacter sp.]
METSIMQLMPVNKSQQIHNINEISPDVTKNDADNFFILPEIKLLEKSRKFFIEANTNEVSLIHLKDDCIVPVFSKDNEMTISHTNFIETVQEAATMFFNGESIDIPEVRVSHIVKGRIPEAIYKPVNELLDSDKTIYYERMAFCFEIPSIYENIDGNKLNLSIGGVRTLNHENLYGKKSSEKFKVFIGFKNLVCCNLCISTDGLKNEIRAMNTSGLLKAVIDLFINYLPAQHLHFMSQLKESYLSEHQFAQLIGKARLYQNLPSAQKKLLPNLEFTDSHINLVAKSYYSDENFCKDERSDNISLWKVYNLFTGANKNSYIDNFLDRSLNASQLIGGINKALNGDDEYRWFID